MLLKLRFAEKNTARAHIEELLPPITLPVKAAP